MRTFILPEDLMPTDPAEVIAYDYNAQHESTKQQVDLSMNTFSFLLEGYKEVYSDANSTAISNSEFLLMKAGKCLMTEKLTGINNSYRSVLFFFTNEAVFHFANKYAIALSKSAKRKTVQSISYDHYLRSFAISLAELINLSQSNRSRIIQIKFEELMLYLTDRLGAGFLESLVVGVNDHDYHFQEVIENNKLNKLTLNELAFLCNMSLSTFKRTFERKFQLSPSKWFQERRLEHAAFLLKNEGRRPSDIFLEIGYESLTNFIQSFKSKYGVTPKQYQSD